MKSTLSFVSTLMASLLLPLGLAACGGGATAQPDATQINPALYVLGVDHNYFPLTPGWVWTYEGIDDGSERLEIVRTLETPEVVAGVPCVAVYQEVFLDGLLAEVTTEWYAEDQAGNVWKFGERSLEEEDGAMVLTPDSWRAGVRGAFPWMQFPANPLPGQVITGYQPIGEEDLHVVSINAIADTPAGQFQNCLQIIENPDDPEDTDIILYGPGAGRVVETHSGGQTRLTGLQKP